MKVTVERQWQHAGLDCEVIRTDMGHRCGYVRVPESHPWHGLGYNEKVPNPKPLPDDATVDDYGMAGAIAVLAGDVEARQDRIELQVRVHGGVTFSGERGNADGWWLGFDCAHLDDTPARWTEEATVAETERMAEQVASFADWGRGGVAVKLLVCGSRDWPEDWMWWVDARMIAVANEQDGSVHVITGGARGVDRRAEDCAIRCAGFSLQVFPADWGRHGRAAGHYRNRRMLDEAPDLVLAFHYGDSPGTQSTINQARRRGIPVEVYTELPPPDLDAIDSTP